MFNFSRGKYSSRTYPAHSRAKQRRIKRAIPIVAVLMFTGALVITNLSPQKVKAAIAFDHTLGTTYANVVAPTLTTTSTASAGSTIIVTMRSCACTSAPTNTLTVTGGGLSWSTDVTFRYNSNNEALFVASAYAPSGLASGTTLTFTTLFNNVDAMISAQSFTGIASSSPVDTSATGVYSTISDTAWSSANMTTTNANDLIFGSTFFDLVTTTFTPGTGYSESNDFTANTMSIESVYKIVSSTGTYAASGTAVNASPSRAQVGIAYKANNSSPAAPTLSSPANSATGVSLTPQFQLRTTDSENDYIRYEVQICSTNNCSSVVRTACQDSNLPNSCTGSQTGWSGQDQQTSTAYTGNSTIGSSTLATYTYQLPPLSPSTQYWWRAYAIDPGGTNTSSSAATISTFTTASNAAPATPTLIAPAASATNVAALPLFQLRTTDANADYLQYYIQLYDATACGGSLVATYDQTSSQTNWSGQDAASSTGYIGASSIGGSTIANYQTSGTGLTSSHIYSWRAKAIDSAGTNTFSSLTSCQDFTTGNGDVQINGGTTIQGGTIIQ
jgi:hypothetical protein